MEERNNNNNSSSSSSSSNNNNNNNTNSREKVTTNDIGKYGDDDDEKALQQEVHSEHETAHTGEIGARKKVTEESIRDNVENTVLIDPVQEDQGDYDDAADNYNDSNYESDSDSDSDRNDLPESKEADKSVEIIADFKKNGRASPIAVTTTTITSTTTTIEDNNNNDESVCASSTSSGQRRFLPRSSDNRRRKVNIRDSISNRLTHLQLLVSKKRFLSKYLQKRSEKNLFNVSEKNGNGDPYEWHNKFGSNLSDDDYGSEDSVYLEMMRDNVRSSTEVIPLDELAKETKKFVKLTRRAQELWQFSFPSGRSREEYPIEVRVKSLTYKVPVDPTSIKIKTVYNSSFAYKIVKIFERIYKREQKPKPLNKIVLDNINLVIKPGKMYLILGNPGCGKSSLLRAIAGRLKVVGGGVVEGEVCYNGKTLEEKSVYHIENAVAFIDQLDMHAPRLTVNETFEFAYKCKAGGGEHNHAQKTTSNIEDKQQPRDTANGTDCLHQVNLILETLGLMEVKDTFVGDTITVRGVSGGQRRRVTVGEMLMERTPILCADEISTGLDAASTYEMIQSLVDFGRIQKMARVIALLQPSPETVSLFDDVILIAEGKILFAGPIDEVEEYFGQLGYNPPEHMDVADFLQLICTPDATTMYSPPLPSSPEQPYSSSELAHIFDQSRYARQIREQLEAPSQYIWEGDDDDDEIAVEAQYLSQWHAVKRKYANSFPTAAWLNMKRSITIWKRDKRFLIANAVKNIIMGISVGGVFFQTDDEVSVLGCLFQAMLFIMLGAMTNAPGLLDDRSIYYKHKDANFFSAYPFVLGRVASQLPQSLMDVILFGTILYFMVGLTPNVENYFIFIANMFGFSVLMNQFLSVFAAIAQTKATVQVASACVVLFLILFGGFIVPPNAIPDYYIWIYWMNPFAWAYRAVIVNEYRSSRYQIDNEGDAILKRVGFTMTNHNNQTFGREWVYYGWIYMFLFFLSCFIGTAVGLTSCRHRNARPSASGKNSIHDNPGEDTTAIKSFGEENNTQEMATIPFTPVTLTFHDICYDVKASTGKSRLRLLHNVNGIFRSGRMCALMGSSGAGKTTLMDVLALRKNIGTCSGHVKLNGFLQEKKSFRRVSGYVEQFDVQSPELTVRETVLFSARLRLNPEHVQTEEEEEKFVNRVLKTLELEPLVDCLVGSEEEGGLSFEQKKRLSIAVELAASPSIIFLDEPTSGLDARGALVVVKLLRRIADEGRTICATIHQPSSAVFEMFHDLLLLKKGGEVVYFGELGDNSRTLVDFFEEHGARSIDLNENPANWILEALASDEFACKLALKYKESQTYKLLLHEFAELQDTPDPDKKIVYANEFATTGRRRQRLVNNRITMIYWRSPAYNHSRMLVSVAIAIILGSIFIGNRNPEKFTESGIRAWLAVLFLSFIIVGILSMISVLPVMVKVRDMYYRHRAAGMIGSLSLSWSLGVAEKWFLVLSSFFFCFVFMVVSGLNVGIGQSGAFLGFYTFNIAIYSYFGQAFVCFVKSMATAQILASVFIGLNNFFSGFIVRPQFMKGFFQVPYWITPGHYVYEGMIVAAFSKDERLVIAEEGTDFYEYLVCGNGTAAATTSSLSSAEECLGTVAQYVESFYGGKFDYDNLWTDAIILGCYLVLARVLTYLALKHIKLS